jgi:hypothetical protein
VISDLWLGVRGPWSAGEGARQFDGSPFVVVGGVSALEGGSHRKAGGGVPDLRALLLAFEDDELAGLVEPGLDGNHLQTRRMQRDFGGASQRAHANRAVRIAGDEDRAVLAGFGQRLRRPGSKQDGRLVGLPQVPNENRMRGVNGEQEPAAGAELQRAARRAVIDRRH